MVTFPHFSRLVSREVPQNGEGRKTLFLNIKKNSRLSSPEKGSSSGTSSAIEARCSLQNVPRPTVCIVEGVSPLNSV